MLLGEFLGHGGVGAEKDLSSREVASRPPVCDDGREVFSFKRGGIDRELDGEGAYRCLGRVREQRGDDLGRGSFGGHFG